YNIACLKLDLRTGLGLYTKRSNAMANPDGRSPAPPVGLEVTQSVAGPAAGAGGQSAAAHQPTPSLVGTARYVLLVEVDGAGRGCVARAPAPGHGCGGTMKRLGDGFRERPGVPRRFLDEARIAGQLQHPGVPAVHDLGTLPDGRPFLAMKLVKGQT